MTDYLHLRHVQGSPGPKEFRFLENSNPRLTEAHAAAQKLEATFLAEMLKAAGLGEQENSISGGAGEDQFASIHRQAIADKIAEAGGIGLTEHFLRSMLEKTHD